MKSQEAEKVLKLWPLEGMSIIFILISSENSFLWSMFSDSPSEYAELFQAWIQMMVLITEKTFFVFYVVGCLIDFPSNIIYKYKYYTNINSCFKQRPLWAWAH